MELLFVFFFLPIRGSKAPLENIIRNKPQGPASLKYLFLWASSPVHNLNIPISHNMCSPPGLWSLTDGVSPPCLSQEQGKIIVAAPFTTDSKVTLDFHQSSPFPSPL